MERQRVVPFDTGKVKIGLAYIPPIRTAMTVSEERLQRALLAPPPRGLSRLVSRLLGR